MNNVVIVLLMVTAYILGSIPNALWIGRVFRGIDIREHGSKNTGSTNAARVLGAKLGILTLILDVSKGAFPLIIALFLEKSFKEVRPDLDIILILIGICAIIGHSFSLFLKFRGGKAVATTLGVFLVLVPKAVLVAAIVFFSVFAVFRYVSLSSISAAVALPVAILVTERNVPYAVFGTFIAVLIIVRHKSNIERLLKGTETKFTVKNKK